MLFLQLKITSLRPLHILIAEEQPSVAPRVTAFGGYPYGSASLNVRSNCYFATDKSSIYIREPGEQPSVAPRVTAKCGYPKGGFTPYGNNRRFKSAKVY